MSSVDEDRQTAHPEYLPTFCFHKVTDRITFGSTNYSPRRLARLLEHLQSEGFDLTSDAMGERRGRGPLVTFDDGYAHLVTALPPLIERFGLRPTVFVPTAWIGKANRWDYSHRLCSERHLNTTEIRELCRLGAQFGSHGHRHVMLTGLSEAKLREDLATSKNILEDIIGTAIDSLSYPFGRVNKKVTDAAMAVGFTSGFTMRYPEPNDPALERGRYAIYFYDTPESVQRKLGAGWGRRVEKARADLTNRLSYGTILLNRIRRTDD